MRYRWLFRMDLTTIQSCSTRRALVFVLFKVFTVPSICFVLELVLPLYLTLGEPFDSSWKRPKKNRWIGYGQVWKCWDESGFWWFLTWIWILYLYNLKLVEKQLVDCSTFKIILSEFLFQNDPYPDLSNKSANQGFFWVEISAIKAIPSAFVDLIFTRWLQTQCFSTCM